MGVSADCWMDDHPLGVSSGPQQGQALSVRASFKIKLLFFNGLLKILKQCRWNLAFRQERLGVGRNLCRPAKSVEAVVFAGFDLVSNRRSV
jgi:hypothetical protein